MTTISPIPLPLARRPDAASSGMNGLAGIGVDMAATVSPIREIAQDGGAWLAPHAPGGSAAFWTQLLGQLLPQENLLQPAVIQEMHASYARHATVDSWENHEFFSPNALDNGGRIDLYS